MEVPDVYVAGETATEQFHDAIQNGLAETIVVGEARPEPATPRRQSKTLELRQRSGIRFGFLLLVGFVAVGTALAALYYRGEMGAVVDALDLFPSTR